MNKKALIALLLGAMLVVSGCTSNAPSSSAADSSSDTSSISDEANSSSEEESPLADIDGRSAEIGTEGDHRLEGLVENEYDGLEMTAAVLPRMAILPGSSIPVTVTVKNTGEKTLVYTKGSGSFTTPQALFLLSNDLQPILPDDQTGIATMDFRVEELKPGEEISFVLNVRAIAPNENFDNYTYELKNQEQTYIADMEWTALQEKYTDLTAVAAGSYDVDAYFTYFIQDGETENVTGSPSGFAKTTVTIGVSE